MGNLARATFEDTTLDIWPWSYNKCDKDIETKQLINACNNKPDYGFHSNQGRGSPEIDIFEVMPGHEMPNKKETIKSFMSSSLQISPGISKTDSRPLNGIELNSSFNWYEDLVIGHFNGQYNYEFWGQECGPEVDNTNDKIHKYMEDAISINTNLNSTHFDDFHVYRIEWQPGIDGFLYWYLDDDVIFGIEGESLQDRTGGVIPFEPMYLILNIGKLYYYIL
jgi:hypothetical protein